MQLNQVDSDGMVTCPYNKVHRMLPKRLQSHLIKCRLSYPDVELQTCPFNKTHLVPEPEYVIHVTHCPDRKLITQYRFEAPIDLDEQRVIQKPIECDENWDDTEVEDYDPRRHVENVPVLRRPEGLLPAQRKAFVRTERKRLGDYDSDDDRKTDPKLVAKPPQLKAFERQRLRDYDSNDDTKTDIQSFAKDDLVSNESDDDGQLPPTPPPPNISGWKADRTDSSDEHFSSKRSRDFRERSRSPKYGHSKSNSKNYIKDRSY